MEPEGDEDVIDWDAALDEIGEGEWEFVLDMVSELFVSTCEHVKTSLVGCLANQKRGADMDWDEFLENVNNVHRAAHTIKGAARQVYCNALGNASETVEHEIRLARDIKRNPELAESKEDRAKARETLSAGMALISGEPLRLLVTEGRKFAAVVGKLDETFLEEEAEDDVLDRLDGAGVEKYNAHIGDELVAFGWSGEGKK